MQQDCERSGKSKKKLQAACPAGIVIYRSPLVTSVAQPQVVPWEIRLRDMSEVQHQKYNHAIHKQKKKIGEGGET